MSFTCKCPVCDFEYTVVPGTVPMQQGNYLVCPQCNVTQSTAWMWRADGVWRAPLNPNPPACAPHTVPPMVERRKNGNPKDIIAVGRVPMWLLSTTAKIAWAVAQFAGLLKYGAWNWRADGARFSTYLSAIERHVEGLKNGEWYDPVDGTLHTGNIMACAALITDAHAMDKLIDDRPPRLDHRPALAEAEATMVKLAEQYKDMKPKHWTISDTLP